MSGLSRADGGVQSLDRSGVSKRAFSLSFAGPKRVNDPGIPFEALPRIDAVLVSHAHYDHLDLATLLRLVNTHRRRVITPLGNDVIMRRA
jgi:L-ascorbate metabolism protein UlaG (beta-lactamase superfamily)